MANVVEGDPAGTVTDAGTFATAGLELVRDTATPPAGATAFKVTVPVEGAGPMTPAGERVNAEIVGGAAVTVRLALLCVERYVPVTFNAVSAPTTEVVTVKFAEAAPSGMNTLDGTDATVGFEEDRFTKAPPAGAANVNVAVAVAVSPPITEAGEMARLPSPGGAGVTVNEAVLVLDPAVAEMVIVPAAAVEIAKSADVEPAGTVTVAGTAAMETSELERATAVPPAGAAPVRVTVPAAASPPTTDDGVSVKETSAGAPLSVPFPARSNHACPPYRVKAIPPTV